MKYIIPCLIVLMLVLIFYPNDYDEVETTIYIGNNKYYAVYDRQSVYSGPDTAAMQGNSGKTQNYGGRDMGEWIMPINSNENFYVSSLIGYRILSGNTPKYHRGLDLSNGKNGSAVLSIGDGSVVDIKPSADNSSGFGICVTIRYHSSKIGNFCAIYAHLDSYDSTLTVGSFVKKGQEIGKVGNTGGSTGPHLHWQLFYGTKYTDLYSSFNPFQVLYPVENKAKAISDAYGLMFYEPDNYEAEKAFYAAYSENSNRYSEQYKENQWLGMLLDEFFK